ncbi:hypothetical protein MANES_11G129708v8 [Manihot esculenta]|uniref:Uncharacterized protein n=1 Tax=Manihot esculenta TaxID=3983 RepID=A0ACB7GWX7_MANES|nr:hypothetical protein MANES_11G129708v8 [Manihot esculenta]
MPIAPVIFFAANGFSPLSKKLTDEEDALEENRNRLLSPSEQLLKDLISSAEGRVSLQSSRNCLKTLLVASLFLSISNVEFGVRILEG